MQTKREYTRAERIEIITARDGYFCFFPDCGKAFESEEDITFDHWWPQSHGGTWEIENLRLMHKRCNAIKGDRLPNPDGTLPVLQRDLNAAARRQIRRTQRAEVCTACNSGRSLGPEDVCDVCGSMAMPPRHPQWSKMKPQDCTHEGVWWCWACMSGIIERSPAILDVLNAEEVN